MEKATILYAEDDRDDFEILQSAIGQEENSIIGLQHFNNGQALMDHLEKAGEGSLPQLILLDYNMPVLNGRETLSALKAAPALRNIPVIMLTTSPDTRQTAFFNTLNTPVLQKASTGRELSAVVAFITGKLNARQARQAM